MNCLTDAAQENPNDRRAFSSRDSLTIQITCRWDLALGGNFWPDDHTVDGPDHPNPMGRRAARPRRFGLHPQLFGLGQGDPAGTLDGAN